MNNKKQLVISIIIGIALLLIGGGLGILFAQEGSQQIKVEAIGSLSSRVVSSMVVYGQVKNIDGRDITLSNLGDNLTISIIDNAQVYSFTPDQQEVEFEDIKIGDNVNIAIKLFPTGQLEGLSIIILSTPSQD